MHRLVSLALAIAATLLLAACQSMVSFPNTPPVDKVGAATVRASLAKPDGKGPFPAVVLLHSCAGLQTHVYDWSSFFVERGYAALAVDSFGSRGLRPCPNGESTSVIANRDLPADAYGALEFLAAQPDIATDRIYVMGFSIGGWAIGSMATRPPLGPSQRTFRAGIALYDGCHHYRYADRLTFPTLVVIGTKDGRDFPSCEEAAKQPPHRDLEVHIIDGAYHAFDINFGTKIRYDVGARPMLYDPAAVREAKETVERYLARR